MLNILIRTSYRPTAFARCVASIKAQTYTNYRVIVSVDDARALTYIPDWCEVIPVRKAVTPYGYNLYCNDLKAEVKEGWFFFLDDDDRLYDEKVLEKLAKDIKDWDPVADAFIVKFIRGEVIKPYFPDVIKGKIGMPCIVVDSKFKSLFDLSSEEDADFEYISNFFKIGATFFSDLILVRASRRGGGYKEE